MKNTIGRMLVAPAQAAENCRRKLSEKNVHALRVAVKKYRALSGLIDYSGFSVKKKKTDKLAKGLFRVSGQLRDFQVMRGLVMQMTELPAGEKQALKKLLDQKIRKAEKSLGKAIVATGKGKLKMLCRTKKRTGGLSQPKLQKTARGYLQAATRKFSALAFRANDVASLHKARKLVKRIVYLCNMFPGNHPLPEATVKKLWELQAQLGKWHDLEILARFTGKKKKLFRSVNKIVTGKERVVRTSVARRAVAIKKSWQKNEIHH